MSKENEIATLYRTASQTSTHTLTLRLEINETFQRA